MKKELFDDLVASIKEAGQIHRGEMPGSREFAFDPEHVRRESQGASEPYGTSGGNAQTLCSRIRVRG